MQNQASIHPQSTPSSDSHHNDQGNQFYPQPENEPQVTFKDVQRRHGVAARLFVGNLPISVGQQQLMQDLHGAFRQFGNCYVGLYSTAKAGQRLPGAFVQYERPEDAERALSLDRQCRLHSRVLRVERATGERNRVEAGPQPMPMPSANVFPTPYPPASYTQTYYPQTYYPQMPPQWYPYQQGLSAEPTWGSYMGSYMEPYMAGGYMYL
ncbi:hypothetical protein BDV32DRAFT_151501 [Aspergillus pseudonomiae]|uniref:Uncharacterized protein n=1 Tax=Aspergillus pseudonomiae TaxID=1506151 RepID=A0A5N7DN88_9EURO|nr:uncharacterized protein BDV37DRAFT_279658 [Aspergillus pseudonomiae]KAB8258335.1 hypothetical protein BDV32DRAFT_151501 [Aspergillus pseudonomiae]KAE8407874.1 hypothetical protein BDV37DRAFT_279658 [Aspergillus pseudonomiae]